MFTELFGIDQRIANGTFNVYAAEEMNKIQLIDFSGKIMETIKVETYNHILNVNVQRGIYLLHIQFKNGTTKTTKIEIQ